MLEQRLIPEGKYGIKCPYSMTPEFIIIHNTANDAAADNEASYMSNNNNEVSFHIVIDDLKAIQLIPFNRNSWNAGDGNGNGNRKGISIEICYSKSGGPKFIEAEKRAVKEVAALLKQYKWGIDRVKKHQDFSGKYCPHRTLDMGWQRFLNMIQDELNVTSLPTKEIYRVRKKWADAASQKGAYAIKGNAIAECNKYSGYNVYDSNGNSVYSNTNAQSSQPEPTPLPTPSKRKIDSFIKVDGYSWVKNLEDYAGVFGVPVKNLYAYPNEGEVLFRVSPVNRDYYSWVQNYKTSTGKYDFAGNGVSIDRLQMKLGGLPGYRIKYRVHLLNGDWLPWVYDCHDRDDNGYAGVRGKAIDAIEVKII